MDHYCAWVFNTIGACNYRHFYLAVVFQFLGALFGLVETWTVYRQADPWQPPARNATTFIGLLLENGLVGPVSPLFFLCLICGACVTVVGPFLCWHTWLSCAAMTTIEWSGQSIRRQAMSVSDKSSEWPRSPYCLGGWGRNLATRLGVHGICGMIGVLLPQPRTQTVPRAWDRPSKCA